MKMIKTMIKKLFRLGLLLFCLWLFYQTIEKIGWKHIVESVSNISFIGLICIFLYPITWRIFQSYSLYLGSNIKGASFLHFFNAQVASLFVMDLFPFGGIGGEVYRVYFLHKRYPKHLSNLLGGIVLYNIMAFFVLFLFFCVAVIYLTIAYPLSFNLKVGLISFTIFLLFIFIIIFFLQKNGLFIQILNFFGKIKFLKSYTVKAQEKVKWVDDVITQFFNEDKARFIKTLVSLVIVRILGIVELLVMSYFVVTLFTVDQAVWLTLVDNFVQTFLFFMPGGQIGVLESIVNGAGILVSIPLISIGVISIWKRIRTLAWAFIGLLIIIFSKTSIKESLQESELYRDSL